jgi:hypothetical protein
MMKKPSAAAAEECFPYSATSHSVQICLHWKHFSEDGEKLFTLKSSSDGSGGGEK